MLQHFHELSQQEFNEGKLSAGSKASVKHVSLILKVSIIGLIEFQNIRLDRCKDKSIHRQIASKV